MSLESLIRGYLCLESLIRGNFGLESLIRDYFVLQSLIRRKFGSGPQPGYLSPFGKTSDTSLQRSKSPADFTNNLEYTELR